MKKKKTDKTKKFFIYSLLCGVICFVLVFFSTFSLNLMSPGIIDRLDQVWLDSLFKFRQEYFGDDKRYHASEDIVLVLFDDVSDSKLEMFWPYDRSEIAKIVDYLSIVQAKSTIFDVIFHFPKDKTPSQIESDNKLINAVKHSKNVYLGAKVVDEGNVKSKTDSVVDNFTINFSKPLSFDLRNDFLSGVPNFTLYSPFDKLLKNAKGLGFFTSINSSDNIKRTNDLIYCNSDNKCIGSLAFSVYLNSINNPDIVLNNSNSFILNNTIIPLDKNNRLYINWLGGNENIARINQKLTSLQTKAISDQSKKEIDELTQQQEKQFKFLFAEKSAWKILHDYNLVQQYLTKNSIPKSEILSHFDSIPDLIINPTFFKNKNVFIGVSSKSAEDFISSPYGLIPGVNSHAYILDSLLKNSFIKPIHLYWNLLFVLLVCLITSVCVFFASSKDSIFAIGMPLIFLVMFCVFSIYMFGEYGIILSFIESFLAILLSTLGSIFLYFTVEGKSKKLIKTAMSNYLSPQILKEVMENPDQLKSSASQRKELTILFSDIRGFTTFSEKNPAELVVKMLNEYLFDMTNIIFKYEGTLDKFIGDAVMAFWGAPVDVENHPLKAIKTALEMKEKVIELNEIWKKVYKHTVQIGIGINTEEVVVGNLGSEKFMDYTVIGDGVNLTARLESLNKTYETTIIISEYTYRQVKDYVEVRYLDKVKVKGKDEDTLIYELIDLKEEYK